jgi:hypothetical protein
LLQLQWQLLRLLQLLQQAQQQRLPPAVLLVQQEHAAPAQCQPLQQ